MDAKKVETKVIKALSNNRGLPGFALIECVFGKGLIPDDETRALKDVLSGMVQRGILETDTGWYRLSDHYETAAGRPREAAARRTYDSNSLMSRLGRRKTVRK